MRAFVASAEWRVFLVLAALLFAAEPSRAQPPLLTCTPAETLATQRHWFFGNRGALDFGAASSSPTAILGPAVNSGEGTTVVSDIRGRLQFWTNGLAIYDRTGGVMANGDALLGGNGSAVQQAVAFPAIGSPGRYFVIVTSANIGAAPNSNLSYSVVDMSLNLGLGGVTATKNVALGAANSASEALTAIPDATGTGFWVVTTTNNSPNVLAYHFDANGPTGSVVTSTMSSTSFGAQSSIAFSADGTQVVTLSGNISPSTPTGRMRVLTFDAATGTFSERFVWDLPPGLGSIGGYGWYSAEFSPNGDYVYASQFVNGPVIRYRLAGATSSVDVAATFEDLGINSSAQGGYIRRGPDGKMYVANNGRNTLSIINNPDSAAAGYVESGLVLASGAQSRYGLPQMVTGCPAPVVIELADWGDLPENYATSASANGARHTVLPGGPYLGTVPPDLEGDGSSSTAADGDDAFGDDEDGVTIPTLIRGTTAQIDVTVGSASAATRLQAWIDWGRNGSFAEVGDQILVDAPVVNGVNTFNVSVPGAGYFGPSFARFRIADQSGLGALGTAASGEVEDYAVTVQTLADIRITKTDNSATYSPGTNVTYTIVATNAGPSPVSGQQVRISDIRPTGTTGMGWTCTGTNGADCHNSVGTILTSGTGTFSQFPNPPLFLTLPPNAFVTVTQILTVPSSFTGDLVNRANVLVSSAIDPNQADNSATDTNTVAPADLAITKVSAPNPYDANAPFSYTIVASNLGPGNAPGATISDTLPPELAGFGWTCSAGGGATCGTASGSAPAISTTANLPVGGSVTILVTGTLPANTIGTLTNTATIVPPPNVPDPVMANNTATDVNPRALRADLRISKASTPNPYVPGDALTYTIVVSNDGPDDAPGARVQDPLPAAFAAFTWTCVAGPGAACQTATGVGSIDALVDLPVGTTATFTATGTVPPDYADLATNIATISPPATVNDPVPGNNTATSQNPPGPLADLRITKAQTPDPYGPGQSLTYTLLVENLGPSNAANARVQDVLPDGVTNVTWTCAASGTGASCASANGVNIIDTFVTLPVGTTATFTIDATVVASATGLLINTATVTAPVNVTDPVPGNNTSTVTSGGAPLADLSIVKTASANPYLPGGPLSFTILVSNNGPSDAPNARVQDLFPADLSGFTWTCAPSAGAAACDVASGISLIDTLVDLPAGAAVTFTVSGTVPSDTTGSLTNTATVAPLLGIRDPDLSNNLSAVTIGPGPQVDLRITKTSTPNPYVPGTPITYTITATNDGPSGLFDGRIQDVVPPVLQNVTWTCSATNATCPAPSGAGSIDALVDIAVGGTVTFTLTGDVPSGTGGALINTAIILPPPGVVDLTPNNNTGVDTNPTIVLGGPVDLQITQEFPGVAPPNGLLTFRLRSRNLGSSLALNPYMTGMIPPGTTFVSVTPSAGGTCNIPGNPPAPDPVTGYPIPGAATEPLKCTWPGLMKPGESHFMEFTVRVAPGTPTGQILWSCWWTWPENEDVHHANNVVDAYLFVNDGTTPVGDLHVQAAAAVVSAAGPDGSPVSYETIGTELAVRAGSEVPVRFWATNHGPAATRGQYALILDTPNTIQIVDITLPQGWVSPSGPSSGVWDTGLVQPGQTVALDMTVRLLTPSAVELFAQRITGSPGDPNATNERATIVLDGYAPGFAGRWVAVGNVDGAGAGEIVTGAGQGETPQVRVFTGTGADTGVRFFAYERPFTGGVQIASCDVNGDGISELITAPGPGRAPTIRVLSLVGGVVTELIAFDAFEASFTGGVSVACADLDADGSAEIIIGAGSGRAPEVQVYNVGLSTVTPRATFLAYEAGFLGGVRVSAGVYPGRPGWLDAFAIATTPGPGRAAELRLFTPTGGAVAQVVVSSATKGVLPTLGDVNGDGQIDLLLAPDDGRPELVRIFEIDSGEVLGDVPGNLPGFPVGIRTAVGVLGGGPGQPEIVIGNGPGGHPRVRVIYWPPAGPVQRLEILPLEIP